MKRSYRDNEEQDSIVMRRIIVNANEPPYETRENHSNGESDYAHVLWFSVIYCIYVAGRGRT